LETYFVDSNVFFYAKIRDKKYGDACAEILRRLTGNQLTGATSTLAILETSNALRKYGRPDEIEDEVTAIYSLPITIHELLNMDIRLATEIQSKTKVSPYDCAHAAIMKRNGITTILSADAHHFDHIPGIKRIDPLASTFNVPRGKRASRDWGKEAFQDAGEATFGG
jgi:uncharacterized protein